MNLISIRKAQRDDVSHLIDLMAQLGYPIGSAALAQNLSLYLEDPDRRVFVALAEGKMVGCLALDIAQTFHREEKQMRIVTLVVDRSCRRQGIGKRLLEEAEKLAEQSNCWVIEVTSSSRRQKEGTHDFYEGCGYLKNGEQAYFRKMCHARSPL